ncbi:MAG: hypothetical protein WB787_16145 [Candidatus Acidiferrales bacterium]
MCAAGTNPRRVWSVFQSPVIHTGIFAGVLLVAVMLGSLIAATRMPRFDSIASLRNLVCFTAFGLVMTIPVARYFGSPWKLFTAGITGWVVLAAAYASAAMFFDNLVNRLGLTPLHLLMLGAVIYGVLAVMVWVATSITSLFWHQAPEPHVTPVEVATRKQ